MRIKILFLSILAIVVSTSTSFANDRATYKSMMKSKFAENTYAYKECPQDLTVLCARAEEGQTFGEFYDDGDKYGAGKLSWKKFLELNNLNQDTKRSDKVTAKVIYARSISKTGARDQQKSNPSTEKEAITKPSEVQSVQSSEQGQVSMSASSANDRSAKMLMIKSRFAENIYAYKDCPQDLTVLCARAEEGQTFGEFYDDGDKYGAGKLSWEKFLELNNLNQDTKRSDEVTAKVIYARSISKTGARESGQNKSRQSIENEAKTKTAN